MIVDINKDSPGKFTARKDITVLPADDPKKLKIGWIICETPWMRCYGMDLYAMCLGREDNLDIKSESELSMLSITCGLDIEDFERLLFRGYFDNDRIAFLLALIREKEKENERKRKNDN